MMFKDRLPPKDNGCRRYPDCLSCPFEDCVVEGKELMQLLRRKKKSAPTTGMVKGAQEICQYQDSTEKGGLSNVE